MPRAAPVMMATLSWIFMRASSGTMKCVCASKPSTFSRFPHAVENRPERSNEGLARDSIQFISRLSPGAAGDAARRGRLSRRCDLSMDIPQVFPGLPVLPQKDLPLDQAAAAIDPGDGLHLLGAQRIHDCGAEVGGV